MNTKELVNEITRSEKEEEWLAKKRFFKRVIRLFDLVAEEQKDQRIVLSTLVPKDKEYVLMHPERYVAQGRN